MEVSPPIFRYDEFRKFLIHLKSNYPVTSLGAWDGSNAIILRHDVDLDMESAYRLALLETECKIESTFFVMTSLHTYNPFSPKNRELIRKMATMGFEIGLHFDPSVYPGLDDFALARKVDEEARMLSTILGGKIKSVSIHNPSVHGKFLLFDGYHNAYDKRIFSADRYLSDSRMIFQHDIYKFVRKVKNHAIQLLLHPMYYTEDGETFAEIFYHYVLDFLREMDETFKVNSSYLKFLQNGMLRYLQERSS